MSPKHSYDVLVIGGGTAGIAAVESARLLGANVCLIEKAKLGGTSLHETEIPSASLLRAAKFYRSLMDAKRFGITVGSSTFSYDDAMHYRDTVVESITGGGLHANAFEKQMRDLNVDVRFGKAKFEDDHFISVGAESLHGKTIVIATGCEDFIPEIKGLDAVHFLSPKDLYAKKRLPKSIAVIGGGKDACDIATIYATFGTRVVLLEQGFHLLHDEDEECVTIIEDRMKKAGIEIVNNAIITEIVDGRGGVYGMKANVNGVPSMFAVEHITVATGKRFNGLDLGVDAFTLKQNESGFVFTNADQSSSIFHLFIAGDACGKSSSSILAKEQGTVAGFNAARMALQKRIPKKIMDEHITPRVVHTDPEFASIGYTSEQAKKKFGQVLIGRCQYEKLHRSLVDHESNGLIKLVAHTKTGKIVGGSIAGACAGELIHEIAIAMQRNMTVDKLASISCVYPTYAEGIQIVAKNLKTE